MKKTSAVLSLLMISAIASAVPLQRDIFPYIKGWQSQKEDMVYTQDNLFDLIDGAAEIFIGYGFADLHITEYQKEGVRPVRVELYRHSSALNTFGMYSAERRPNYSFIDMGTQGYIEDGVLNFFIGVYYVKISTDEPKESGRRTMMLVAQAVSDFLRQTKGFPPALKFFPQDGRTANSEGYIAESFLGYKCLRGVYTAGYEDTAKVQLFIIPCDTPAAAQSMLTAALKEFGQTPSAPLANGIYPVKDRHNGSIQFLLKGAMLCGVAHCADDTKGTEYLHRLEKSIAE